MTTGRIAREQAQAPPQWRVRRRWLPWRRRIRDLPDVPTFDVGPAVDNPIGAVLLVIGLIIALPALVALALLLFELLLLLALLPLALLGRMLLPMPWTIELWSRPAERRWFGWHLEHELRVAGWDASSHAVAELRERAATLRPGDVSSLLSSRAP